MSRLPLSDILDAAKVHAIRLQASLVRDGGFFLAGGTGLGLRLCHRRSRDLDWFTAQRFDAGRLRQQLERLPEKPTRIQQDGASTLRAYYGDLETSFIAYDQVPARPEFLEVLGVDVPVADVEAIAAMKAAAVHDRGQRRDFIDIHAISGLAGWSVGRFIEHASRSLPFEPDQVARALTYFVDAESDDFPAGYTVPWEKVKQDLLHGVREWERDRHERAAVARELAEATQVRQGAELHRLGIRPETIADARFSEAVRQAADGALLFPFQDAAGVAGLVRHPEGKTPPSGDPEKGIWTSRAGKDDRGLVIVDSPIEALCYLQANATIHTRYVATGARMNAIRERLVAGALQGMSRECRLTLAFPAGSSGRSLAACVKALAPERTMELHLPPRGRSWTAFVQEQQRDWIRAQGLRVPGRDRGR